MEFFLLLVPLLMIMIAILVFAAVKASGRSRELRLAWSSGLTAEARCLRTYTKTSGGHDSSVRTTLHHVYEFRTWDGRVIRFDEAHGPSTRVEGDIVIVHYTPDRPERATAHAPNSVRNGLGTGLITGCLVVMILIALFLMLAVFSLVA
ncbi:DUF3592 domain-containing protein [Streptomyces phyllanthi]|uniref:DUF3592 domain-containing protein n=1 Tax=Streptomyces phyllanthi TaxID=1803180 RepID=A0A5N8WCC4_9ACTN|nr:DUF3592 domain-containing protein [Streptomyces phyllanthi]MPY44959.1 hypothetical protein [Streptomyces phyllanthi]